MNVAGRRHPVRPPDAVKTLQAATDARVQRDSDSRPTPAWVRRVNRHLGINYIRLDPEYVTLDHKTSHKGTFFDIEIYNLKLLLHHLKAE